MTTTYLFANNAKSTLAAPMSTGATTMTLFPGTGALFPNPGTSQQFPISLLDQATASITEIMYCTARSGDVLTVIRAQEGTSARSWVVGDFANCFITAQIMTTFSQVASIIGPQGGPTSARTSPPMLYETFFDTTLGFPVFCTQISPPIWVDAAGVVV